MSYVLWYLLKVQHEHENQYLREKPNQETYVFPLANGAVKPTPQRPTQTLKPKSSPTTTLPLSTGIAALEAARAGAVGGGRATNVIERRGEHNKNLDEPFLPQPFKPKVFVSEPQLGLPRTPSIKFEFKNRPVQQQQQQQQYFNKSAAKYLSNLDILEAASAAQLDTNSPESSRILNFNMYEDFIRRKQPVVSIYKKFQKITGHLFKNESESL